MSLSYPLSRGEFQNRFRFAEVAPFRLQRYEEVSGTAAGRPIIAQTAASKWVAEFRFARMRFGEAAAALAMIEALGAGNRVNLYDLTIPFPRADPGGVALGEASVLVTAVGFNNRSLRITGLPDNYVISAGDMISVGYGSPQRRWLGRAVETVEAIGSGTTPLFDVMPTLPAGLGVGASVILRRPYGVFVVSAFDPGVSSGLFNTGMRFSALQVPL